MLPAYNRSEESFPMSWFLRGMRRFYAYYLGVTPPPPEKEKLYAVIVIGGTIALFALVFLFGRFIIESILSAK